MPRAALGVADTIIGDADSQYMLVLDLSLAGRAAVEVVDAGRLQAWLAMPAPGEGVAEAAGRAAQLMMMWHNCSTCHHPASTLAEVAQRMLVRARRIRVGSDNGTVDVYCTCSEVLNTPGTWKAVSMVHAADQERWHRLLDGCAYQARSAVHGQCAGGGFEARPFFFFFL
jgi:hypothetical protein